MSRHLSRHNFSLPVVRSIPNVAYLRFRSIAEKTDPAGLLIESVQADVLTVDGVASVRSTAVR